MVLVAVLTKPIGLANFHVSCLLCTKKTLDRCALGVQNEVRRTHLDLSPELK